MMKKVCLVAAAAAAVTVSPVAGVKLHRRVESDKPEAVAKEKTTAEEKPAASGEATTGGAAKPTYKGPDMEMDPASLDECKDDAEKAEWLKALMAGYVTPKPGGGEMEKARTEYYEKYGDDCVTYKTATQQQVDTFLAAGGSSGGKSGGFCCC